MLGVRLGQDFVLLASHPSHPCKAANAIHFVDVNLLLQLQSAQAAFCLHWLFPISGQHFYVASELKIPT